METLIKSIVVLGTQAVGDCLKNPPLWEDGIKPKAENFEAWNITKEGLLLSFDACQLTGCASGEFYVSVPYSELMKLMRPVLISDLSAGQTAGVNRPSGPERLLNLPGGLRGEREWQARATESIPTVSFRLADCARD